jgi:hypothetical protein
MLCDGCSAHGYACPVLEDNTIFTNGRATDQGRQGYQFIEKEYMKAEDYDHFIADHRFWFGSGCLGPTVL